MLTGSGWVSDMNCEAAAAAVVVVDILEIDNMLKPGTSIEPSAL